jgi:hypothetical protein
MRSVVKFIVIAVLFAGFVRAAGIVLIALEKRKSLLGEAGRTSGPGSRDSRNLGIMVTGHSRTSPESWV